MLIKRLNNIEEIIALQENYFNDNGIYPLNVSNWTVSDFFRKKMEPIFQHNTTYSPIDYLYSYSITPEIKKNIMCKLGAKEMPIFKKTCIIFPNNSLSIVNICNLLHKMQYKKIGILNPAYFSIDACLRTYNLHSIPFYITRQQGKYIIPFKEITSAKIDALWITSPIYSTGVPYDHDNMEIIEKILRSGILVIADESFCVKGQELICKYSQYKNFLGIYSPHKSISFNSYKFSTVICDNSYEDFFEQWLDVFCGNLPQTTIAAIYHYLSDNYDACYQAFQVFIKHAHDEVISILKKYPNVEYDNLMYGNLMTLFINNLNYDQSRDIKFMNNVIQRTHALFYPGYLNGFSKEMGFCFRINLALYHPDFIAGLERLLLYLRCPV